MYYVWTPRLKKIKISNLDTYIDAFLQKTHRDRHYTTAVVKERKLTITALDASFAEVDRMVVEEYTD